MRGMLEHQGVVQCREKGDKGEKKIGTTVIACSLKYTLKKLTKLNTKKINNPIKKWAKDVNRYSPKRTYRWPIYV